MNILICDVVTPVILYPIIYWPFVLAGLVLIVIGILLFRFLKRKISRTSLKRRNSGTCL